MHDNYRQLKVKLYSQLSQRYRRYGRFTREQILDLKLALASHFLTVAQRILPAEGVLSRSGEYWHIPALEISLNLKTGDFFPLPFDLSNSRRLGDIIAVRPGPRSSFSGSHGRSRPPGEKSGGTFARGKKVREKGKYPGKATHRARGLLRYERRSNCPAGGPQRPADPPEGVAFPVGRRARTCLRFS